MGRVTQLRILEDSGPCATGIFCWSPPEDVRCSTSQPVNRCFLPQELLQDEADILLITSVLFYQITMFFLLSVIRTEG